MKIFILSFCTLFFSTISDLYGTSKQDDLAEKVQKNAIDQYMILKDALVKSDAVMAKDAAKSLSSSMKAESMDITLIEAANLIASLDDLKSQRIAFKTITDGLITSLKANDSEDGVFVQYCPMAFNNTGASWLSMSEEIRNPYFGDMMLKCGKVEEKL